MTIEEAKRILANPCASVEDLTWAAFLLCVSENDSKVTLSELVGLLKQAANHGRIGEAGELAALALYRRTGRKRDCSIPYKDFVTDPADWEAFIQTL